MKSERRMRKAYLLKDIENFEKYYLWSLETKNLKPIFDGYVKNNLEEKLIEYDVNISIKDYRITDNWLLPEFEDANPFYFYYNIKFRDVYNIVSSRLGEVSISEDTYREINNKPRLIIPFLKMTIDLFIQDAFRGDLRLIYLFEGSFDELKSLERNKQTIDEIEILFHQLSNSRLITKLYLYAMYFKYFDNIEYIEALDRATSIVRINEKDIIDLQNSFKSWRNTDRGKKLESKVIEIVNNQK